MNALTFAKKLEEKLIDNIRNQTLRIEEATKPENGDSPFTAKLDQLFQEHPLVQDPYLELTPPYDQGCSLQQLVDDHCILQRTADIFARYFGGTAEQIRLHQHQENAVRAACRYENHDPKNMVVCAGTGSGKTECFLLPVIDTLLRLDARGALEGEVYVMLLYPMNALVNDQLIRLRKLLKDTNIRFGKYTGELKSIKDEGNLNWSDYNFPPAAQTEEDHQLAFDGTLPLVNELTKRSQWQNENTRGHIMVTNYSMLERLLLNPEHSALFTDNWKYIVIDEAHSYNGSLGTDMAWLIRRLVHRLGNPPELRFLATSATLSNDENIVRDEFASKLFPAENNTFKIIFGKQETEFHPAAQAPDQLPDLQAIPSWEIDPLPILGNETKLIKATQRLEALKEYNSNGLFGKLSDIARQENVSFADAVFILKMLKALKNDGKIEHFPENGFFVDTTPLHSLLTILKHWFYLSATFRGRQENEAFQIHNSDVRDFWREYLHDCIDARKSTYQGDLLGNGLRNPIGNRLYILTAWENQDFRDLDSLIYLLKIAEDCVFDIQQSLPQQNIPVGTIRLQFSTDAKTAIDEFCNWKDAFQSDLEEAGRSIEAAWSHYIVGPQNGVSYRVRLAWLLSGGNENSYPSNVYGQLLDRNDPNNTCFSRLVTALGFENNEAGANCVDTLFSLGSLARFEDSRFPLLDLRIHQFVRGLKPVGIYNLHQENGQFDFELTGTQEPEIIKEDGTVYPVFNLGVCLSCGTPYILGYKNNDGTQLARYLDDNHPVMTAFLFPGIELRANAPQYQNVYVDFSTGRITDIHDEHGANAVELICYSAQEDSPEALTNCLCCEGLITVGNRYRLITPFEASSASSTAKLQMLTLDTLAKAADPSGNPFAYALPGQGRKLLAFSDSRQGAARFAIRYQEFLASSTLKDLLFILCQEDTEDRRRDWAEKVYDNGLLFDPTAEDPNARDEFLDEFPSKTYRQFCIFKLLMEQNRLTALFDLSADDTDLSELQVATFRFLQALCSGGFRNNLIWNERIRITSIRLAKLFNPQNGVIQAQTCLNLLQINGANQQLNLEQLQNLCQRIYRWLFLKCTLFNYSFRNTNVLWSDVLNELNQYREECTADSVRRKKWIKYFVQEAFRQAGIELTSNKLGDCIDTIFRNIFRWGPDPIVTLDGSLNIFKQVSRFDETAGFDFTLSLPDGNPAPQVAETLIPLTIQEHTAQISKNYGKAFQEAFSTGKVNILSCSTTFEMGVDLGDLNCLYLSNLPPSAANYRQRAGRAGRRAGSMAYVLTMLGNGENDDEYYFDHATEFIFGEVEPPRIYLENPVYRARHLRAEAFHEFWKYMAEGNRLNVIGHRYVEGANNEDAIDIARNMSLCSHFFAGYKVYYKVERDQQGNVSNSRFLETMHFDPISNNLDGWYETKHEEVNNSIKEIANASNVEYDISADFLWQLTGGREPWGDEQPPERYSELGGRKKDDRPLKVDFLDSYIQMRNINQVNPNVNGVHEISGAAYHLMQEQTVERLCRKRILPKYGFPVDVIALVPNDHDPYKNTTDRMEREKNIAIYEYAPGMSVVANKRVFSSGSLLFSQYGELRPTNIENITTTWYRCPDCKNVFDNDNGGQCPVCGEPLESIRVCSPDGFSANPSTAYKYSTPLDTYKGRRLSTTFSEFAQRYNVPGLNLRTGTSLTAEIVYLNMGMRGNGFSLAPDNRYYIYHKCMTDIVFWEPTGLTYNLFNGDRPRFRNAMLSASYAIIKAAADVLHVRRSEIGGLSFPYESRLGFVLYDTTPGGNGILTELALRNETDTIRGDKVRRIIERALEICRGCNCNHTGDENLPPASFSDYMQNQANLRLSASCYKCLRDYSNQADHEKLDRYDAAKILEYILHPAPEQTAEIQANGIPQEQAVEIQAHDVPQEKAGSEPEELLPLPDGFVPMQEEYEPIGARCFMRNGEIIEFTAKDRREDILGIEEE